MCYNRVIKGKGRLSMRIGKYIFENVDWMEAEELEALQEAVNLRREHLAGRERFLEEVKELIKAGYEQGYRLTLPGDGFWADLSSDTNMEKLKVEDTAGWI